MMIARSILLAGTLLASTAALAGERGVAIRAGDIFAEPFVDAPKVGAVAANQPVTILARKGGWLSVEVGGKRGWMRMLGVRLEAAPTASAPASMRTGSTSRTVATGVKGLEEGTIMLAAIDNAQVDKLDRQAVNDADARAHAAASQLSEAKIADLKPGKVK